LIFSIRVSPKKQNGPARQFLPGYPGAPAIGLVYQINLIRNPDQGASEKDCAHQGEKQNGEDQRDKPRL
jgi:hypothetical protein